MHLVCLDFEGVLVPEIWVAFSEATGIKDFMRTTREEPDYDKLMRFRIELLNQNKLKLADIQRVIAGMQPYEDALEFISAVKEKTQLIILTDTFMQFAKPLAAKLDYPTMLCNVLETNTDGTVTGYKLRQQNGKKEAVKAFKSMNIKVFAAGDSFNDLTMIREADSGCLFRAPEEIKKGCRDIPCAETYDELLAKITEFCG